MNLLSLISQAAKQKYLVHYAALFLQFENRNVVVKINQKLNIKQRVKSLTFKTFKKWPIKEDFSAETDEQGLIVSLVCCDSLEGMTVDQEV